MHHHTNIINRIKSTIDNGHKVVIIEESRDCACCGVQREQQAKAATMTSWLVAYRIAKGLPTEGFNNDLPASEPSMERAAAAAAAVLKPVTNPLHAAGVEAGAGGGAGKGGGQATASVSELALPPPDAAGQAGNSQSPSKPKFCGSCGSPLSNSAIRFCTDCGASLT